jgi:hypothetical protein
MDFSNISTESIRGSSSRRRHTCAGLTMAELMMAIAIASIVTLSIASFGFYSSRSFAALANYVELDHRSRVTLDTMSRDIRQANRLTAFTPTSLTFEDYDGGTLSFVYDPQGKTLSRIKDGVAASKPLLTECTFLKFSIYQRNPIVGTYNQYETATASTCKLVQLQWVCSRKILGVERNTESVQSAKVVIRKQ